MKKEHNIAKRIFRLQTIKKIDKKIKLLGNTNYQTFQFLTIRLFLSCFLFLITLFFLKNGYILAPLLTAFFYLGSEILFF